MFPDASEAAKLIHISISTEVYNCITLISLPDSSIMYKLIFIIETPIIAQQTLETYWKTGSSN